MIVVGFRGPCSMAGSRVAVQEIADRIDGCRRHQISPLAAPPNAKKSFFEPELSLYIEELWQHKTPISSENKGNTAARRKIPPNAQSLDKIWSGVWGVSEAARLVG
jgi:hypothetical protein